MSQVITPPDVRTNNIVYLVINAELWDVELIVHWLKINNKDYTIHIYHEGMNDLGWLKTVGESCHMILYNKNRSSNEKNLEALSDHIDKIKWFGKDQDYPSAVEYLVKYG
jgi:hypothetical protein